MDAAAHSRYRELLLLVSDASRWRLLYLLRSRPRTVGELVACMDIEQPAVSHHLGRLRRAGLVGSKVTGRSRCYSLTTSGPDSAVAELHGVLGRWFDGAESPRRSPRRSSAHGPIEVHLL